ncbi:MAG: hypothetical protein M3400_11905 [Actinomycetota bacterium]|nr:hypothetical protein [Actinomycetota bacterium]
MSFLGAGRGRTDAELEAGNRRSRLHFARDINDVRTIAASGERPPAKRRRFHWTLLFIAVGILLFMAFAGGIGGGQDVALDPDCENAAIGLESEETSAGTPLRYRLAGPDDVDYIVTLDGEPIRGDGGSEVPYEQTPAGPVLRLQQCLSPTLVIAAPAPPGPHELAMLRLEPNGETTELTTITVTVTD